MSVFANGREVSGKATPNKSFAAFPDVCMSPPSPPTGPTPVTYVVCGVAKDTANGTSSVFIKGKEVGKKNATKYSKVTGNQPATRNFGAGIISHNIVGALKFASYSNDVFFEKGGANRFLDLTTLNHANNSNGTTTNNFAEESQSEPPDSRCVDMRDQLKSDRSLTADTLTETYKPKFEIATISIGSFTWSNKTTSMVYGCSNQLFADKLQKATGKPYASPETPPDWAVGGLNKDGERHETIFCKDKEPVSHFTGCYARHAEMNILNKTTPPWDSGRAPSSIIFCIDYPSPKNKDNRNKPCKRDMGCKTALKQLCTSNGGCVDNISVCRDDHTLENLCG